MPLNIKNAEVERLVSELAVETGESKTEVVRKALEERGERIAKLRRRSGTRSFHEFLVREIWSQIPTALQGKRLSKKQHEKILGYGPDGV